MRIEAATGMPDDSAVRWFAQASCLSGLDRCKIWLYAWSIHQPDSRRTSMFDMKNLGRLKKLDANAPDAMKAFWTFDKAAFAEGALTVQQKQLMAVAVALTTQCPYCIELHSKAARDAGASEAQLAETALVAAAIRAGGAITHATHLFGG